MGQDDERAARSATDAAGVRALLTEVYDQGLLHHAYTPYMRDYELVITASSDPRLGRPVEYLSYLFVNCVEARAVTAVSPAVWRRSLDDELLHPDPRRTYDAYAWGIEWQILYPVFDLVEPSDRALEWSAELGIPFHELLLESDGHELSLVFSELRVREVAVGYAPFVVEAE